MVFMVVVMLVVFWVIVLVGKLVIDNVSVIVSVLCVVV